MTPDSSPEPAVPGAPMLVVRARALLDALRDGPLPRPDLLARLSHVYPPTASARRMVDRDIMFLKQLGIEIERSAGRPPVYCLRGGAPIFSTDELRTLALIRDTFGPHHPQAPAVQALLAHLTTHLTPAEQHAFQRRQALHTPVEPAIDYTPHAGVIARLETAITRQQTITFVYHPGYKAQPTLHTEVEPYEIEFYERHFYLVAYSEASRQVHDFRIDRIQEQSLAVVPGGSWSHPRRPRITFQYRLAAVVAQGEISQRFEQQRIIEWLPNGDLIIEAQGRSEFFILRTLLKYASNAELLSPAGLRAKMAAEVARLAALYRV